jgi:uncharacterized membrane protein
MTTRGMASAEATGAHNVTEHHGPGDHMRRVNVGRTERRISTVAGAALAVYGATRGSLGGLALAVLGGALAYRGLTGHCNVYGALGVDTAIGHGEGVRGNLGIKIERSVVVDAPPAGLYRFWRNFENLPRLMTHVERVTVLDASRSRWTIKAAPGVPKIDWEAEIINDVPDQLIAWQSHDNSLVHHAGSVRFEPGSRPGSTVVRVSLQYDPPGGTFGHALASLFGADAGKQVERDLQNFKRAIESGDLAA